MHLSDLFEDTPSGRRVLIIYPGRFHPFHKGHAHVFQTLKDMFPEATVVIATSAVQDESKSPFHFLEKKLMMEAGGVHPSEIVQVKSPYSAKEVYQHEDPDNTILIYAVGKEVDRLKPGSYLPLPENKNGNIDLDMCRVISDGDEPKPGKKQSARKYQINIPVHEFTVLGKKMTGATEIRSMYPTLDDKEATMFVQDLFGTEKTEKIRTIMDQRIGRNERDSTMESVIKRANVLLEYIGKGQQHDPHIGMHHKPSGTKGAPGMQRINTDDRHTIYGGHKAVFVRVGKSLEKIVKKLHELRGDSTKRGDAKIHWPSRRDYQSIESALDAIESLIAEYAEEHNPNQVPD